MKRGGTEAEGGEGRKKERKGQEDRGERERDIEKHCMSLDL